MEHRKILLIALISLIALLPLAGFGQRLTQTPPEIQIALDSLVSLQSWTAGDYVFTNALTSSYSTNVPSGGFTYTASTSTNITINSDGTFVCNFTGTVSVEVDASFAILTPGGPTEVHTDVFYNETDTDFGFQRSVSTADYGAAACLHPALSVTNGGIITIQTKLLTASKDMVWHSFGIAIDRID